MSCPKGPAGPIGFLPLTATEAKARTETSRENNKRIYQDDPQMDHVIWTDDEVSKKIREEQTTE